MDENFYQILGVGPRATPEEIKAAYKKLARQYHPDANQGSKLHEERFKKIAEAYQTLSNSNKKDLYDLKLFYKTVTNRSSSPFGPDPAYRGVPKTKREREREEYEKRRSTREAYREYTGPPPSRKISPNTVAITLLVLGCVVMMLLWLGQIMNHLTAKSHLERGDYAMALHFDPEYGEAYFARYKDRRRFTSNPKVQLFDLNLAVRYLDPPSGLVHFERARVYMRMDSLGQAEKDLRMSRNLLPNNDTIAFAMGDFQLFYRQNAKLGLAYYDSSLLLNPNHYEARFGKGYALFRLERFPEALASFDACLSKNPNDRRLYFYKGSVLLALGKTEQACFHLDQALTMGMEEAKPLMDRYCKLPQGEL